MSAWNNISYQVFDNSGMGFGGIGYRYQMPFIRGQGTYNKDERWLEGGSWHDIWSFGKQGFGQ